MAESLVYVEVEESPNCPYGATQVYKALEAPRPIHAVRLYEHTPAGEDYEVTGWSSADGGSPAPAQCAPIEDSGAGFSYLVWGGDLGIRVRPPGSGPWDMANPDQWGDTHFVLSDAEDLIWPEGAEAAQES